MIILKAKYLITNPEHCIENGAVAVNGTKIYRIGTFEEIKALANVDKFIDLGNAVILPGLINIHTHLDLTNLHNRIKPTTNFTHWVFQIVGQGFGGRRRTIYLLSKKELNSALSQAPQRLQTLPIQRILFLY